MSNEARHLPAVLLLFALGLAAPAGAAGGAAVGGTLLAHNRLTGNYASMSAADGQGFHELTCGGDLSRGGAPRYFVRSVGGPVVLPDGYNSSILVVADETCGWSVVLSGQPSNVRFSTVPQWSPDASRIAVFAKWFDLDAGIEIASLDGIYVADVVRDGAGRPVGIENFALAIQMPGEVSFTWSGEGGRIAHAGPAPDGKGGQQMDLFVVELASGDSYNLTGTEDTSENSPSWSPVDERIAFSRLVTVRGNYRYDIFVVSASGGSATQVTSKGTTGKPQNLFPCFSPDGQSLSFSSGDAWYDNDLYRIRADGSGKAVNLTAKRAGDFRLNFWRD